MWNQSTKVALAIDIFDKRPNVERLLEKLKDYEVTVFCYDNQREPEYPCFFINYILNTNNYDHIIACDKTAAKKCEKFKRKFILIDLDNQSVEQLPTQVTLFPKGKDLNV